MEVSEGKRKKEKALGLFVSVAFGSEIFRVCFQLQFYVFSFDGLMFFVASKTKKTDPSDKTMGLRRRSRESWHMGVASLPLASLFLSKVHDGKER